MHALKFPYFKSEFAEGRFIHLTSILSRNTPFTTAMCHSLCFSKYRLISNHEFYTGCKLLMKPTSELRADMTPILAKSEYVYKASEDAHGRIIVFLPKKKKRKRKSTSSGHARTSHGTWPRGKSPLGVSRRTPPH